MREFGLHPVQLVLRPVALGHVDDADQDRAAADRAGGEAHREQRVEHMAVGGAERGFRFEIGPPADRRDHAFHVHAFALGRPEIVDRAEQRLAVPGAEKVDGLFVHVDRRRRRHCLADQFRPVAQIAPEIGDARGLPFAQQAADAREIELPERHRHGLEHVAIAELAALPFIALAFLRGDVAPEFEDRRRVARAAQHPAHGDDRVAAVALAAHDIAFPAAIGDQGGGDPLPRFGKLCLQQRMDVTAFGRFARPAIERGGAGAPMQHAPVQPEGEQGIARIIEQGGEIGWRRFSAPRGVGHGPAARAGRKFPARGVA